MHTTFPGLALLGLAFALTSGAAEPKLEFAVRGQGSALDGTPVVVRLETPVAVGPYRLQTGKDRSVAASVFREGNSTYLAAVLDAIPAEGQVVFNLVPADAGKGVQLVSKGDDVEVTIDGLPFTTYVSRTGPKPYYFPLIGPTGRPITRAFPMKDVAGEKRDHPHHRSMWFTHGMVNGVDFWSEQKGHGSIVEKTRSVTSAPPAFGQIRTTDDWVGPDGKVVCTDERTVRFYATPTARIIDFDISLKASNGPVTFGDTKEGMFGVRVATSMDVDSKGGGKITNSDGLNDAAAWGKPAPWVDYTGPVEGETVGIAILNHPSSFRYPTTWHVRTYGLFAANPFGWHDFGMKTGGEHTIPPGESIRFGYRVILHKGDTPSASMAAAYEGYIKPPTVTVKTK